MRKRSCAFHAETNEDYIKIAIENQDQENFFYNRKPSKPIVNTCRRNMLREARAQSSRDDFSFGQNEFYFEDNDRDLPQEEETLEMRNSPSTFAVDAMDDSAVTFDMEPEVVKEIKINCMLIGAPNVGKHALINSQFPNSTDMDSTSLMRRLDLVVRQNKTASTDTSCHFWIKELMDDSYEKLIELYYKRCSFFVYVYDLTSKASFEKMEEEIIKVRKCVGESRFNGLLIAINSDKPEEREVSYEEGISLKNKYNLQYFSETSLYVESETHQLLKKLESIAA